MPTLTRRDGVFIAALILLVTIAALPVLTYPLGRDQGMYANIARSILDGGLPFISMWDVKPPAIYYLYAAGISLFGAGSVAIRAIDLVIMPLTLLTLYHIARHLGGNRITAFFTGLLFAVFYFTETFASLTQSDSLVTFPLTLAVWCLLQTQAYPRASAAALRWAFVTGALCALTIWFKHYYAFFVLALVIHHLMTRKAFPVKEVIAFCLGGLPVGAIPLLYFMQTGIWQEMLIVAEGTAQYNAQASGSLSDFIAQMSHYLRFRWEHWGILLILAAAWLFVARQRGWGIVWLWLAAILGFVLIQAKGFDTHWLPMLPALSLLGGAALIALLERIPARWHRLAYGIAAALIVAILIKDTWVRALPYLTGTEDQYAYYERFQANDLKPAESLEMIAFLAENTQPGDSLFIFGFRPEVYYLSGLRPATRFQAQFPLVAAWWREAWKAEAVETLWAALPPYVLVLQADYMAWVTGVEDDSAQVLNRDPSLKPLEDWLIFNYERDGMIGNFLIWKRKSPA